MFKLSNKFVESYKTREVPWGPVGYIVFKRTYARKLDDGTTEEWYQTCKRVIETMFSIQEEHCLKLGLNWSDSKAQRTAQKAYERMFVMKWTPPGRGLWAMKWSLIKSKGGACLNNCAMLSTDKLQEKGGKLFAWVMDALMLGIGVGFDTKGAGTKVLGPKGTVNVVISDDREGWVSSVEELVDAYLFARPEPLFDYSLVRPEGALINGFGGVASGPGPLRELHELLRSLLASKIGSVLTSVDVVDICNLIGRCVVSGNVRRSAEISLGDPNDRDFMTMKDPALHPDELAHHRWCSNNSINAKVGMDYSFISERIEANGEPGLVWLDNISNRGRYKDAIRDDDLYVVGVNPCSEMQLESMELCNLCETYPWLHDSYEDWLETLKYAYMYAKTITLVPTHWPETNAIMLKNRRIGLSVSGFDQACEKFGTNTMYTWLDAAYEKVQALDRKYSDWLCVPRSKRTTAIKPSGTVSLLNGSTPGMHWGIAKFAIRRIVFANTDPLLPILSRAGYLLEESHYYPNSIVVEFPIETKHIKRVETDVSMWEQLERAAQLQYYWCDNLVSCTVKFKPEEARDISRALDLYQTRLKSISFLPHKEHSYVQMPYEAIDEEEYRILIAGIVPVDFSTLVANAGIGEKFCDGDKCTI